MPLYPSIKDPLFNTRITRKYKRFQIPKKRKTFRQICYPTEFKLQLPQQFVANFMNPKTPYKSLLVYHGIGSGKTLTAVNMAEKWIPKRRIMVVVPASLKGTFRNEIRLLNKGNKYLSIANKQLLQTLHPSSNEYKAIIKKSNKIIDKYYDIYSYNKFVELAENGEIRLNRHVLIVDEAQNMVSENGSYYKTLYKTIHEAPSSLRIALLSATPMFNSASEIAITMNLLRLPFELPTGREFDKMFVKTKKKRDGWYTYSAKNLDIFKERVKGFISFNAGAPDYVYPSSTVRYVKCEMSNFQYQSYKMVLKSESKHDNYSKVKHKRKVYDEDIVDLPNNFFIGTRLVSNVVFPNKKINEAGFKSFRDKSLSYKKLHVYSPKFAKMMKRINAAKGPVFVYSNFKEYGGIKSFIRVLENQGYKNYIKNGEGRKRFAIWSGDEKDYVKEEIKAVYNQPNNINGSRLKVMLGSPSIKEGVSLLRVRQIHVMEPYWNQARLEQVIGRGIRYCSHKDMDEEDRHVKVYIYIATHPKIPETIDQYIQKLAYRKNKLIKEFENAIKEVAVDCQLNWHANNTNIQYKDDRIVCDA
jgi:superfamily II DNA or RNA helicase